MENKRQLDLSNNLYNINGWAGARNILLSEGFVPFRNEPGSFNLGTLGINPGLTTKIIGKVKTGIEVIVILARSDNKQEIGVIRGNSYEVKVVGNFGFVDYLPVDGVFKYNYKKELIVVLYNGIDNNSVRPYLLNLDNLPFQLNPSYELLIPSQLKLAYLFPEYSVPIINIDKIESGAGNVMAGAYFFSVAYEINDKDTLFYSPFSEAALIGDDISVANYAGQFDEWNFSKIGYYTNKSVKITISNIDTLYKYLKVVCYKFVNGTAIAETIGRISITGSNMSFTYSGNEATEDLDINQINVPKFTASKINAAASATDRLHIASFKTKQFDYREYANQIKLTWETKIGNPYDDQPTRSFMPGEVYAFYAHLVWKDGTISEGFHIPGRQPILVGAISENSDISDNPIHFTTAEKETDNQNGNRLKYFHVKNTARSASLGKNLGVYVNENEEYPLNYPGLSGKVRHHVMPDYATIYNAGEPTNKIIGVKAENIIIPFEISDEVQGVLISYAKRTLSNSTVIGNTIVFNQDVGQNADTYTSTIHRLYNYELLHEKPRITNCYYKGSLIVKDPDNLTLNRIGGFLTIDEVHSIGSNVEPLKEFRYFRQDTVYDIDNTGRDEHIFVQAIYPGNSANSKSGNNAGTFGLRFGYAKYHSKFHFTNICQFVPDAYYLFDEQDLISTVEFVKIVGSGTYSTNVLYKGDVFLTVNQFMTYRTDNPTYAFECGLIHYCYSPFYLKYKNLPENKGKKDIAEIDTLRSYNKEYSALNLYSSLFPAKNNKDYSDIYYNQIRRSIKQIEGSLDLSWRTFLAIDAKNLKSDKGEVMALIGFTNALYIFQRNAAFIAKVKDTFTSQEDIAFGAIGSLDIFQTEPDEIQPTEEGTIGVSTRYALVSTDKGILIVDDVRGEIYLVSGNEAKPITDINRPFFQKHLIDDSLEIKNPLKNNGLRVGYDVQNNRVLISNTKVLLTTFGKSIYKENLTSLLRLVDLHHIALASGNPGVLTGNEVGEYLYKLDNQYIYLRIEAFLGTGNPADIVTQTIVHEDNTYTPLMHYTEPVIEDIFKNEDFTISYNLDFQTWVCLHDYKPAFYTNTRRHFYYFTGKKAYLFGDVDNPGKYDDTDTIYPTYIDIVFAFKDDVSKIFTNFIWNTNCINPETNINYIDKTFTNIMVYNNNQCSGIIDLKNRDNYRNNQGEWFFNDFRDYLNTEDSRFLNDYKEFDSSTIATIRSWFNRKTFVGKEIVVRLIYDNKDKNILLINSINVIQNNLKL